MAKILVIGGGPAGLAVATFSRAAGHDTQLWEAGAQAGGNCRSESKEGFTLDHGPNGWLDNEPAMGRLLALAGLTEQVQRASPLAKKRWIYARGALHPAPLSPPALLASRLLSWPEKLRILGDLLLPRGGQDPDETVAAFVRRRLGDAVVDRLVGPMCQGVYAADPEQLALAAAFPRMAALEREHRSLILAAIRLGRGGAPAGGLCTLPGGAGALTHTLASALGPNLRLKTPAGGLERLASGWRVHSDAGELDVDAVVLACPAWVQSALIRPLDPAAARALEDIPYAPINVLALALPEATLSEEQRGFGALVARGEDLGGVLGVLLSSCVFPGQAPEGQALLRVMLGGAVHPQAAALDEQSTVQRAQEALKRLFGWTTPARPLALYRYTRGIPVYGPGHLRRVEAARQLETRFPGLLLTGNHLDGVAIKDCARAGESVVSRLNASLKS